MHHQGWEQPFITKTEVNNYNKLFLHLRRVVLFVRYLSRCSRNKLKSLKVAKWRKDEWRMMEVEWRMNEEWWMMKNEWWRMMISSCWGVLITNRRTDICDCRVAFATENFQISLLFLTFVFMMQDKLEKSSCWWLKTYIIIIIFSTDVSHFIWLFFWLQDKLFPHPFSTGKRRQSWKLFGERQT